jgi:hypothetical protein
VESGEWRESGERTASGNDVEMNVKRYKQYEKAGIVVSVLE